MADLFTPIKLGDYDLPNRILMAPMTRGRAEEGGVPGKLIADYYAQRATAGLIISEATAVSRDSLGWLNAPGLYNDKQQAGWKGIADAVHAKGGRIFAQIWHMGSVVHPDFIEGDQPISSSNTKSQGALETPKGRDREFVEPRPMTINDIKRVVQAFADTAKRAVAAGLDGVEIHAANGFLIDQFNRDGSNKRTDEYGGSIENRLRFLREVVEAVTNTIGSGKVGVRLSPTNQVWGISDSNPLATFSKAVELLNAYNLAYLHILEPKPEFNHSVETVDYLTPQLREIYKGNLIINGGFSRDTGQSALAAYEGDAIAYGVPFIANPDLVERYRQDAELAAPNMDLFYKGGETGYTDYPAATG